MDSSNFFLLPKARTYFLHGQEIFDSGHLSGEMGVLWYLSMKDNKDNEIKSFFNEVHLEI